MLLYHQPHQLPSFNFINYTDAYNFGEKNVF
jgi:hypothetical protein